MRNNTRFPVKILLFLILFGLIFLVVSKLTYDSAISKSNSKETSKVLLQIEAGESVDQILNKLVEGNLLQKSRVMYTKIYLKLNSLGEKIQAGTYEIPQNLTVVELFNTLQNGKEQDIWVTIPEGLRKDEIGDIFEREFSKTDSDSFNKSEFIALTTDYSYIQSLDIVENLKDLEGFLYPDKYAFPLTSSTKDVIEKMVDNFKRKVGGDFTYNDIIVASIVEREGYNSSDKPIIAGIILKRFKEGWLLQTDATLLYPVKDWKHVITAQDKADDNPYNTYKKLGLPPTPICNPGIESISATRKPTTTEYYYYIHDNNGNPHYGKTLDEHNSNVQKYLR